MTLRTLPELKSFDMPKVCAFQQDPEALEKWNAGIKAAGDNDDASISILDTIGEDWWTGEGVTSKRIAAALRSIGDRDVVVNINSPGGDFFEGVAIYNLLRAHPHKVTVRILGLAASAASVIAMAGDDIQIGKAGFLMIHNAWVVAVGNRNDLREAADTMDTFDDAMATVYAERSDTEKGVVAGWMDAETWFNGEQAVAEGLADGYLPPDAAAEDTTRAKGREGVKAVRRVEATLTKEGLSRTESRALLAAIKGGMPDAAPTVMHDADAIEAGLRGLIDTLKT